MIRESDISTEYPTDIDDENLTDKGFLPALPGEPTKISNALALIHVARILSKALEQLYPAAASYSVSVDKARELDAELDEWSKALPSHLRLQFSKDKPSTNVISDRSPLLVSSFSFDLSIEVRLTYAVARLFLRPFNYSSPVDMLQLR